MSEAPSVATQATRAVTALALRDIADGLRQWRLWGLMGWLQFEFLKRQGLQPQHYLLDIGCGSLRGGVHFINFLDKGHYYGIEKETSLIKAGKTLELKRRNLLHKNPHIFHIRNFDISQIGHNSFGFMLAQSSLHSFDTGHE
jgi:hypothetical protein